MHKVVWKWNGQCQFQCYKSEVTGVGGGAGGSGGIGLVRACDFRFSPQTQEGTCLRTALPALNASVALALGHGWQREQEDNEREHLDLSEQ